MRMYNDNSDEFQKMCVDGYRKVYNAIIDAESKFIFTNRQLYSLTGDYRYVKNIIESMPEIKILRAWPESEKDYLFGAGIFGQIVSEIFPNRWIAFVDNNKELWGRQINGVPVISPQKLPSDARIFIAVRLYHHEISTQLLQHGFSGHQIFDFGGLLDRLVDRQYFEIPSEKKHHEHEVFIDGGCCDGWTTKQFIAWSTQGYKKVYAFEPDKMNREKAMQELAGFIEQGKVELLPYGLWREKARLSFNAMGTGGSSIGAGKEIVEVVALDDQPFAEDTTFIKMDIEGAEYQAIQGAEKIIRMNKPNLAICLYHRPEDVFDIPQLILSYRPDYKFIVRHYFLNNWETVLYAI